jgi:hypothetical protein
MNKRILILDLDTPCFAAAAVAEDRSVLVTHVPTGIQKSFKTRTEFKEVLKAKQREDKLSEYSYEDVQVAEPIENACHTLKSMINNYCEALDYEDIQYFISGSNNFRDSLPLPTKYKSSRTGTIRPLLLSDVKKFATAKYKATVCHGEEPDDAIIYTAYDLQRQGYEPILISIDKDSLAYSGLSIYNQDKPEQGIVKIPELGSLWIDDKGKVRGNGFMWYGLQHLLGDKTDSFNPAELAKVKYGEKSAYKLIYECKFEEEVLEKILWQYKKWYPQAVTYIAWNGLVHTADYLVIADLYFKCCRMKTDEFDDLDFMKFLDKYGVKP